MKKIILAVSILTLSISCDKEETTTNTSSGATKTASFLAQSDMACSNDCAYLYINGKLYNSYNPIQVKKGDQIIFKVKKMESTILRSLCRGAIYIDNQVVAEQSCDCQIILYHTVQ